MRRTATILLLLVVLVSFTAAEGIDEVSRYWTIDHYDIKAVMDEDGVLSIEERITANFRGYYHGILKTIPASNDVWDIRCSAPFAVETENNELVIKMGSADTLITGNIEYVLTYKMDPKVKYEFVFTVPGIWSVDVFDLTFSLTIPKDRFYGCAMEINDLLPSGKTFETYEDADGCLVLKGSASRIPAYGNIDLVLR